MIQAHQSLVGNSKKSHDRQLDTLLPEPKSIRCPENHQITVSRHSGLTGNSQYAHLCKFFKRCQVHWHWQIKMRRIVNKKLKRP